METGTDTEAGTDSNCHPDMYSTVLNMDADMVMGTDMDIGHVLNSLTKQTKNFQNVKTYTNPLGIEDMRNFRIRKIMELRIIQQNFG
jgi:hypothetical protein